MNKVFLGIGTNLGDREANLKEAVVRIEQQIGGIIKSSSVYETEPWGFTTENQFLNVVTEVGTRLSPEEVLKEISSIETLLGRVRGEVRYTSRVIDIDILIYDNKIIKQDGLIIPHPIMQERKFVLVPLCEIAPGFIHPVLKKSISEILEITNDKSNVRLIKE